MPVPRLKKSRPMYASIPRAGIVLTDDDQLRTFARDPKEKFVPNDKNTAMRSTSLEEICTSAGKRHARILTFFHDHFFGGGERKLYLTSPEFVSCTKKLAEYAEQYGMGIGASVTNPLDLGRNFREVMGVGGQHRFFAEGELKPDGSFRFIGPISAQWANNKGYTALTYRKTRLFAYTEENDGSAYAVIRPESIREIPENAYTSVMSDEPYELSAPFGDRHMIVEGQTGEAGNRVFAVFYMDTPEMDYFHPGVTDYVHHVIDLYREEGIEFLELYSDEMHIQFDWDFRHFGPHEIPTRYMTENFQADLAKEDPLFTDFDKALIYMGYNMEIDGKLCGRTSTQHVIGRSVEELHRTFRMRRTYFERLQDRVVGICCEARDYIRATYEKHAGFDPLCLGHATWQESPTCDRYGEDFGVQTATQKGYCAYDYTPSYVYSSTIRESISACFDYFKWNDYFSYGGNDFCECGFFDRNYYGGAMAASLGALNRNEVASWGSWGFPNEARKRFNGVDIGYGALNAPREKIVTWGRPRIVDVLYIYPKDLTSVEERFGSWMVQYGYANYVPADRFVRLGRVNDGHVTVGIGDYTTVVVGFEPFYRPEFLKMLREFAEGGGRVVWNAAPTADENGQIPEDFLALFGLRSVTGLTDGVTTHRVHFSGSLGSLKPMNVLTDMLPDHIYPCVPDEDGEAVADANGSVIGVRHAVGSGTAMYMGCRLRDDQTGDSGDGPSTLFDLLKQIGAYGGSGCTDNTETLSRKTAYFVTKFANGTYSVCHHYYPMKELWEGGFGRSEEHDRKVLADYPYMVPYQLNLDGMTVEGHTVSYRGDGALQYRLDKDGRLIGFRGDRSTGVTVDGHTYAVTDEPADTSFGVMEEAMLPDGYRKGWIVSSTASEVDLCCDLPEDAELYRLAPESDDEVSFREASETVGLAACETLSVSGSRLIKGAVPTVVILSRL